MIRSPRACNWIGGWSCTVTLPPSILSIAVTDGVEKGNRRGMTISGEPA
jgi:hypothetical protein